MAETSKTVAQAIGILESLRGEGPARAGALARRLGSSRTVVSRLVATLEAHDLVRRTPRGIELGFGLLDLVAGLAPDLRETAKPHLRALASAFDETAVLAVADGDEAVAIDQVVPDHQIVRVHYHPGSRHSLLMAAHGRAILAFSDGATVSRLTGANGPGLAAELAQIRRQGYAITHDELENGVGGVAAPIIGGSGTAVASLGLVAPMARFPAWEPAAAAVIAAATRIAGDLRRTDPPDADRRTDARPASPA